MEITNDSPPDLPEDTTAPLRAYERQVWQLSPVLQERECGLIELGRQHARNFGAGHSPSGSACQRVLAELRKLARDEVKTAARSEIPAVQQADSRVDEIRARRERRRS